MPINSSAQPTDERYMRVVRLFEELNAELDVIGREAQHLRAEIQKAIDKKRLYRILQKLNEEHR